MDALKPFAALVQQLWSTRTDQIARSMSAERVALRAATPAPTTAAASSAASLRERLRTRLVPLANASPRQRREAFVGAVLLWQLSDEVGADPRFAQIVERVASDLGDHSQISARLEEVLRSL